MITIRELGADTFTNIDIEWDLDAEVYDQNGKMIKKNNVKGKETLEGSLMNPVKASKKRVPEFIYQKVHELVDGVKPRGRNRRGEPLGSTLSPRCLWKLGGCESPPR